MKNNLLILIMLIFCKTGLAISSQKAPIYVKFGPDFLWSQSDNFFIQRMHSIEGTLNPSISSGSLNDGKWTGNVALGLTYPFSSTWHLSPEISFLPLGNYSKSFNPFLTGPYEGDDIINTFNATMKGNVVAAVINIDYLINKRYSIYVAPGLGVANVKTNNVLNYQSSDDETNLLMISNKRRSNFSPQVSIGIKYAMTSTIVFDLGVNYIWLGTIPFGSYSNDPDGYTATTVAVSNAYLLGPKLNLVYYFG